MLTQVTVSINVLFQLELERVQVADQLLRAAQHLRVAGAAVAAPGGRPAAAAVMDKARGAMAGAAVAVAPAARRLPTSKT